MPLKGFQPGRECADESRKRNTAKLLARMPYMIDEIKRDKEQEIRRAYLVQAKADRDAARKSGTLLRGELLKERVC